MSVNANVFLSCDKLVGDKRDFQKKLRDILSDVWKLDYLTSMALFLDIFGDGEAAFGSLATTCGSGGRLTPPAWRFDLHIHNKLSF